MNPSPSPASLANLKPFAPGQSGNPGGKPVAARNKVNAKFLEALTTAFEEASTDGRTAGLNAIRKCRDEDPSAFVRALVALQPKELEVRRPLDDISDEQLESLLAAVAAVDAARDSSSGAGEAQVVEPASGLPALPEAG